MLDGNLIHIRQGDAFVEYRADSDLDALLRSYFRLDADILAAHADLSARDNRIARLVRKYPHLRVLRQPDPWECTVSYICSATTNVNRISAMVESVAGSLGHPLELDGEVRNTFPTHDMAFGVGCRASGQARPGYGPPLQDSRRRTADTGRETGPSPTYLSRRYATPRPRDD